MLNTIKKCLTDGGNTGYGDCVLNIKFLAGGAIVPKDFELTETDLASPEAIFAKLQAATLLPPAQRVYPLPPFEDVADNSEEAVTATLGRGGIFKVRDGRYNLAIRYVEGGQCVSNQLRKFNNRKVHLITWDEDGTIFGQKVGTSVKGAPLTLFDAKPWKVNTGSDFAAYVFQIMLDAIYWNENIGFSEASLSLLAELRGLQTLALKKHSRVTNVLKIKAAFGCDGSNAYDLFADELAVVNAWVVKNPAGALVTVTSVAKDDNVGAWTLTVDTTDPDYVAGQVLTVSNASALILDGLGVAGFESNSIAVAV